MIHEVFKMLRDALNDYMGMRTDGNTEGNSTVPKTPTVVFYDSSKVDSIDFAQNAITMMLVNLEEDRTVLPPDPYQRKLDDGTIQMVKPPVPLNLYVLWVARFKDYAESLRHIAFIVEFFQKYRSITRPEDSADKAIGKVPVLPRGVEKLVCDLISIPINEHNQVWSLLNTAYQPSLLYRIRMVVFHDPDGLPATIVRTTTIQGGKA